MWRKLVLSFIVPTFGLLLAFAAIAMAQSQPSKDEATPLPANQTKSIASDQSRFPLLFFLQQAKPCPSLTPEEVKTAAKAIEEGTRQVPKEIDQHRTAWIDYSIWFRRLNYMISVAIVVFGALATALHDEDAWYRRWKTIAALLATVAAGANTALTPYGDFKKYDSAFVVLNTARAEYLTNPRVSLCDLGTAVAYGETIIHKGE